ncbi:MAG TPA: AAA family ATPase [Candidatus Kapabacteria bacterium]|nr:AAA family ATPase [Candidatus Kapabacteria bacterium]
MSRSNDFLHHGILPFVGRDAEIARITEFWRGTYTAESLRTMLLLGEAGMGKSRLLERAMHEIVGMKGSVVHVKFYPEATATFLSLTARGLMHPFAGRSITGTEPEPKPVPVAGAMQRLARLRPVLFVLEDLHFLAAEMLPELSGLLEHLADETLSVLAVARPVELEAREALAAGIVEEYTLPPLTSHDCADLWQIVSGTPAGAELAAALQEVTAGSPLAMRSALRSLLKNTDGRVSIGETADRTAAIGNLKRSMGLLAGGMTAHLTAAELQAAERLATLGEVFSREAAELMLQKSSGAVNTLLAQGIIATATAPPVPLSGPQSEYPPLAFTHTLLHRHLLEQQQFDSDALINVIASSPLYSVLPFRMMAEHSPACTSIDTGIVAQAFHRTLDVQRSIDRSAQWSRAGHPWMAAIRLLLVRCGSWERSEWERMLVRLLYHKLDLVRREPPAISERWLRHLTTLTANAATHELAEGMLYALAFRTLLHSDYPDETNSGLWKEMEGIITRWPRLRTTSAYTDLIVATAIRAEIDRDHTMMVRVHDCTEELLALEATPAALRESLAYRVRPPLLSLYRTEEELRQRLAQIDRLEVTVSRNELNVWMFCINMLAESAFADRLARICTSTFPVMNALGHADLRTYSVARSQRVLAGLADTLDPAMTAFTEALQEITPERRTELAGDFAVSLIDGALLHGKPEEALAIMERFATRHEQLRPIQRILLALAPPFLEAALQEVRNAGQVETEFAPLVDMLLGRSAEPDIDGLLNMLRAPVLGLTDVLRLCAIAGLTGTIQKHGANLPAPEIIQGSVAAACTRTLEWLAAPDRALFAYMYPIIRNDFMCLTAEDREQWLKRANRLRETYRNRHRRPENGIIRLTLCGTIAARLPNEERIHFQGARSRMLLAVMAINHMLPDPLDGADFCRIAAGRENADIEEARAVVRTTIYRLREVMGREAVLTSNDITLPSGTPPRLNLAVVEVDVLLSHDCLLRADTAVRDGLPMQAKGALLEACAIIAGEVLFPSLFDDFIEAARERFENTLRTSALKVSKTLARAGELEGAAEVLRATVTCLPGDEELIGRLHEMLIALGRHLEAERLNRGPGGS